MYLFRVSFVVLTSWDPGSSACGIRCKDRSNSCIHQDTKQGEAFRGDHAKDREGKEEFRFAIDAIAIFGEPFIVAILVRKQGPLKIQF